MAEHKIKTLTLVAAGLFRSDTVKLKELEAKDQYPRVILYREVLNTDELDEKFLERVPFWRRMFYKLVSTTVAQVIEAFIVSKKYDAVISWGDESGLLFALLLKLTRSRIPHVGMFSWPSRGGKRLLLRFTHRQFDRIIMWSPMQANIVINKLHVPASKIAMLNWHVDQKFFRPMERETDMICAVGSEMRDYETLVHAMRGLDIKCHIAAGTLIDKKGRKLVPGKNLPANVTVAKKPLYEVRELYARSRFVVIPLHQTDSDNGITCILEAFAMGKPVICSLTNGQVGVIEEGKTGIFVPVGDSKALRNAIVELWNNPERAEEMGKNARAYIEQHATLDGFVKQVRAIVEDCVAEYNHEQQIPVTTSLPSPQASATRETTPS
ncbi:MAG: glycosyltransferase family 4 protein [bacterium]